MPKTIKEERLRWILPISNKEIGWSMRLRFVRIQNEAWNDG
jgi:hypothetical protein